MKRSITGFLQQPQLLSNLTVISQAKGNAAFSAGKYEEAITHFSAGIDVDSHNHVLYSNRSAAQVRGSESVFSYALTLETQLLVHKAS